MISTCARPLRILHVVVGMNPAGVETWLLNAMRRIERQRFQMDFASYAVKPCDYDEELRQLGALILPCPAYRRPPIFARNLTRIIRQHGPYDIVHSHVDHYAGCVLRTASRAGVPVRIAHIHSDTSSTQADASWPRRAYYLMMKRWVHRYATHGLAASGRAAAALYGPGWRFDPRWRILHCGIDIESFSNSVSSTDVRAELGMPSDSLVLGHDGRFVEPKNHRFLLQVAAEVMSRRPNTRLVLVGDGPLLPAIKTQARELGIEQHVTFTGRRRDVARLMLGAMDVFLMPSAYEGLGLVLVEAQAAGLVCVYSDRVPIEADVVPPLLHRASLLRPPSHWAEMILSAWRNRPPLTQAETLAAVDESPFSIRRSVSNLESLYDAAFHAQHAD